MKLSTTSFEFDQLPIYNRLFLAMWKLKKGYPPTKEFSFGEVIELSLALTNDLSHEDSDGRTFNNILKYDEVILGWEGQEPLDITFYELNQKLRRRLTQYSKAY